MPLRRWSGSVRIAQAYYAFRFYYLPVKWRAHFLTLGNRTITGILDHGCLTPTLPMPCMETRQRRNFSLFSESYPQREHPNMGTGSEKSYGVGVFPCMA